MAWSWFAFPSLIVAVVGLPLAAFVFLTNPDRAQNRRLAMVLVLLATLGIFGTVIRLLTPDAAVAYACIVMFFLGVSSIPLVYVRFLATVKSPLANVLGSKWLQAPLIAWPLFGLVMILAQPEAFGPQMSFLGQYALYSWDPPEGPYSLWWLVTLYVMSNGAFILGVAVALLALRDARTPLAKRQARAYAAAFLWHDIIMVVFLVFMATYARADTDFLYSFAGRFVNWVIPPTAVLGLMAMLAYGMLQTQLFGIDLKLRFALKQSTVAAILVAVFFAVSETAAAVFSDRWGPGLGIAAAALLVFAIAPLQRLGDRVARAALPEVSDTREYRDRRAQELYEAALESALEDGEVTRKERAMLARLQEELGVKPTEAARMEARLAGGA